MLTRHHYRLRGWNLLACLTFVAISTLPSTSFAQLRRGFVVQAPGLATNEELVRQRDFWVMEVELKPMRLVTVELRDPQTGAARQEQVWYLAWRSIRRPVAGREGEDVAPVNELDPLPGPRQFVPAFTLVTYDNPTSEIPLQILPDEILLPAMDEIRRIERDDYLNSVTVVQDLPEPTAPESEEQRWIYGAATWRNVDHRTDFFKVQLAGFSNGYELKPGPDGASQPWRKILVQRYARPGDEFELSQREFSVTGKPEWTYQPDGLDASRAPASARSIEPTLAR